ncbi:PpiC-type peptidyl-prolyl cis-trans isomerase [uncultured Paludibacter sp.]|nr:PpiC-type peptidyl-prolyl cis-trans isomerase [uncultured Paludibacter sp.]
MATLQKIRNRGVLLALMIGGALFLFVIGDFLNSGSSWFHQSKEVVADIAGEKIKYNQYQAAIEQLTNVYKIETGQKEMNEEMTAQIRKSVWDNFVNEKILNEEAAKIGLSVSKDELTDRLIGKNIHPLIMQRRAFADERGQFSHAALMQFYNAVFNNPKAQTEEAKQQLQEYKNYWLFWEKAVKNAILQEKYVALITKTIGSNNIEAKFNFDARKETGDVSYVLQPYFAVSDSALQVTDAELKARYEKDKELFKQEANRSINYVVFEVAPLAEDFKKAEEWIKKVSEEFKTTDDVEGLVNSESDISYDGRNYSMQTVPANLKDFAFGNSTGAIFGPVFQNNTYTMAKIMQAGIMESDSVKLSHIVVANDKTADSIMTVLKSGANFAETAKKHSLVQQTAANGGDIGWVSINAAGKEISDEVAAKSVGGIFKISSPQGVQIFEITGKSPARKKVKLAILERKVTPSDQSQAKIYNEAKQFAAASKNSESFEKNAKEKGYVVHPAANVQESADRINMIPQSRQVVRWAFQNDQGDVSDVIECGNANFVVATVSQINPKGYQSLAQVTPQLKAEIIKDKKAELISKNLSDLLTKNPALDALATAISSQIKVAPAINFNSFQFGDAGFEPYIIGKASVTPAGKISVPLKGNAGVYVILPAAKQTDTAPFNAKMEIAQMDSRTSYSLPYLIMEKLKEKYEITDNRINFY